MHRTMTAVELKRKLFLILALFLAVITVTGLTQSHAAAVDKMPVLIGLDGELDMANSTSAEAVKQGILIALEEINQRGGVLGGRPLKLVERSNHSVPARSIANLNELASMPDLVAVYCGRFSPTVLEAVPLIHKLQLPLLDPWAAADAIVDNGMTPNFVFRLSLKDSWAAPTMLDYLARKGVKKVGLLMLNTSWGRGTQKAAEDYTNKNKALEIVNTQWINWDDKEDSMLVKYRALRQNGAQGILLTANSAEAAVLAKAMLTLPKEDRLPVASHWGVTGGNLPNMVGSDFNQLDFSVVQTYTFIDNNSPLSRKVVAAHNNMFGSKNARDIVSQVGVAHAYDLTHLLARAVDKAGSTDRKAIRKALEKLGSYDGLVRKYVQPFTEKRHEALERKDVFMSRYSATDGSLEKLPSR